MECEEATRARFTVPAYGTDDVLNHLHDEIDRRRGEPPPPDDTKTGRRLSRLLRSVKMELRRFRKRVKGWFS